MKIFIIVKLRISARGCLMKEKPYLFLDFDLTCTYMYGVKDNLSEFLEFCVNNFKVYWCSYADYFHIKTELGESIDSNLLNKIIYKEVEAKSIDYKGNRDIS